MPGNLEQLHSKIKSNKLDAFLVNNTIDLCYLLNIEVHGGYWALVTADDVFIITSEMLINQLHDLLPGYKIIVSKTLSEGLENLVQDKKIKKMGIDSIKISYDLFDRITKKLPKISWAAEKEFVSLVREIKTKHEIEIIRKSCLITKKVFGIVEKEIKHGISEKALSRRIDNLFFNNNSSPAFTTIVASGKNAAYPHHVNTDRPIERNDVVIVDMGAKFNGYCSDMTRPIFLGKTKEIVYRIYEVVKDAQQKAIAKIKPGIIASQIDKIARDVIEKAGYGKNFIHGTGHGVGLEVHESPSLNKTSSRIISAGMVLTVEPGIYIHNLAGIRIEDTLLVTEKGCEVLT